EAAGLADGLAMTEPTAGMALAYAACDLVLQLTRKQEAFGRTVIEALAVGRPVLGWDHGGVGELLQELQPGGAVAPFDDDALAAVVEAVYPAGHAGSDLGAVPIDGGAVSAVPAAQETPGWRWAPAWVLVFVALWPAPGYAEGVLALGALAGLARLAASRFRGGIALLSGPAWALTSVLFFAYWLPQLVSALDAVDQGRALREAAVDLRYLPFLWV